MAPQSSRSTDYPKSPYVTVDDADAAVLASLARQIAEIRKAFRTFSQTEPRWTIADDSWASVERELFLSESGPGGNWDADAIDYVADAALLFVLAQADHLAVLQQVLSTYEGLLFGVAPPVRSLLEIEGYVHWLLHPDVEDMRVRGARVMLSQINDARRELATAKALNAPMKLIDPLGETVRHLKKRMNNQFQASERRVDKHGNLYILNEKHPGPGQALLHLSREGHEDWNSRGAYAFLSNATHPTLHVILDTIQPAGAERPARFGRADTVFHQRLALLAMSGFLATWQITAAYRGLDQTVALKMLNNLGSP